MTLTTPTTISKPIMKLDFTAAHTIYKNAAGKRIPGVTTVLGVINKPYLVQWANNMGLEGIDTSKFVRDAADKGTVAHALAQCHLTGQELYTGNIAPDVLCKAENAFIKFLQWWDAQDLDVVAVEHRLISEKWQVGGTGDIFARRRSTGALEYIDLKTGKAIYDEMRVQSTAYSEMYEEQEGEHVSRIWILRTGKEDDNSFEYAEIQERAANVLAFEAANSLYRALKKVA